MLAHFWASSLISECTGKTFICTIIFLKSRAFQRYIGRCVLLHDQPLWGKWLYSAVLRQYKHSKWILRLLHNNHEALQISQAKLTHVRNAQRCATSDFDAVFCYRSEIRSALPKKFGIFHQPLQVAQESIEQQLFCVALTKTRYDFFHGFFRLIRPPTFAELRTYHMKKWNWH